MLFEEFGQILTDAFEETPYWVGSSLTEKTWRDVDVRVLMDKKKYSAMGLGDPRYPLENAKWRAFARAFSTLGTEITGLPIDFQIQEQSDANKTYPRARSALGLSTKIKR